MQSPQDRIIINIDNATFEKVPFAHDALSPPWFLNLNNSMGAMNEELTDEEKEFGEAIIEVRAIPKVSAWFLKKSNLSPEITGSFLKTPGTDLKDHALSLFNFLKNFGSESDNEAIFYLGMPYSVREY